jgi:hypothetical protein
MNALFVELLFHTPAYTDCNVGYRIPSSQAPALPSLSIEEAGPDSSAPSSRPVLPPGTAGTASDPRGNVPEVPRDIPPFCFEVRAIGQFFAVINVTLPIK